MIGSYTTSTPSGKDHSLWDRATMEPETLSTARCPFKKVFTSLFPSKGVIWIEQFGSCTNRMKDKHDGVL